MSTQVESGEALSVVLASGYRTRILVALGEAPGTPTHLEERTGADIAHVSRALSDLREIDAAELRVPEARRKGRVYGITEQGETVLEELDAMGAISA